MTAALADASSAALAELAPLLRRTTKLDPAALARIRIGSGTASALVRLPFRVLVSRSVALPSDASAAEIDVTVAAADLIDWLDGNSATPPARRDAEWRGGTPPGRGWQRVETVPDDVIRGLVRRGALALKEAAEREGVPEAQPRAEVADALLDAVVLTVSDDHRRVDVTLRMLSALTRMGFLPRGSAAAVDLAGRWSRVTAEYGSVYRELPGLGPQLR